MAVLDFDPGCTAAVHETSTSTCDHCGICLRCFGTRVLEQRDGGLVAAAPDTPVKTELVQDLEGVTSELVFFFEGGFLVLAEGQAVACFCLDRDEVRPPEAKQATGASLKLLEDAQVVHLRAPGEAVH